MKFSVNRLSTCALGMLVLSISSGFAATTDYSATLLSQGPIGYWRLNENVTPPPPRPASNAGSIGSAGDGQYLFSPRRGEPGAFTSGTATSVRFSNPKQDPGYGASKVEVPFNTAFNPNGAFSVEFWAKPSMVVTDLFCTVASINSDAAIGATNSDPRAGWLFYQTTNSTGNEWQFRMGNTNGYADGVSVDGEIRGDIRGGTVTPGAWHHVVGTFDGSTATLYVNGASVASRVITNYNANTARPLRIGTTCFDGLLGDLGTYAGNRGFDGWLEEVAFYGTALSASDVAAHYNTGTTNGAGYASVVLANKPVGYWRLGEPGNPAATNLGTFGPNANGQFIYSAHPGQSGPESPTFPGFEGDNRACAFSGTNGFVDLPALNLNTNTVTITAWILASSSAEPPNAGIVFSHEGTTVAGLKFDINDPNALSYNWNADEAAFSFKSQLSVPVFQWSFVALIVQPDQAVLCLQDGSQFQTATNYTVHPDQAFEGETLIGRDAADPSLTFNGTIDEVAIFNRALSVGEVYSQYASAVGGVKPALFDDLQLPEDTVYIGDTLNLSVDAGGTPPLTYQWRKEGQPIAGATRSTFSKGNVAAGDGGNYDVVITNGSGSVTSQQVKITIQPLSQPTILQNPQGATLYKNASLNLSVQASGGGLTYQWQKNGTNLVGATNATYQVAHVTGDDSGSYLVKVNNNLNSTQSGAANVTVIVPAAGSYADVIVADNPEAWWRLDDPPGSVILTDAMGRHHGVLKGTVTFGSPGVLVGDTNAAATFDGTSGYAEIPFSKALNGTNFSVECWVKANAVAAALCPVASFTQPPGRGYLLQKSIDGQWYYMFGDGTNNAVLYINGSDAIYDTWTHLVLTYDGSILRAYLNGNRDLVADPVIVPNNIAPFRIGFDQPGDGWEDYWNGDIDEVAVYSKALTQDQVLAHYSAALYGPNAKPVIVKQPQSAVAAAGTFFFFDTTVAGVPPLHLQWSRNGVPLPDKTNAFLVIDTTGFGDTGIYQLSLSNSVGTAISDPVTFAVVPSPDFANVTNGLVLHLTFDGDYLDTSGHTNNATPKGAPKFVTGVIGKQAFRYNTVVDSSDPNNPVVLVANYATLGSPPDLQFGSNVNFSVSYWVRFTGTPGDLPFLCNAENSFGNAGYVFAPSYQLGGWSWSLGDTATTSMVGIYGGDDSINDGEWHHLLHTFDRSGSGLTYLDGTLVDTRSIVPAGDLDSGDVTNIGQDPTGAYPESGQADIDDLAVWRRVLTPFEAYAVWSAGQAGNSFDANGPVSLMVTFDAGLVQLAWQAGQLVESDTLAGPWTKVTGATAPYFKLTPGASRKFYRVQM